MRNCPTCGRSYEDTTTFCLADGTVLVSDQSGTPTMNIPADQEFQPPPPPPIQTEPERKRPTYLMWAGIGLVVVGVVVVVLGIPWVALITGGVGTGLALCALGALFFGLSFARLPNIPNAEPPMSAFGRIVGIFFEPTRVFRNLRAHPELLIAILIFGVLNAAYFTVFVRRITPQRIADFTADKMAEVSWIPPETVQQTREQAIEQSALTFQAGAFVRKVVGAFFLVAILAALYLVGVLAFGGRMHYWQAYAVTAYVFLPVVILQKLISFIVLFIKSPTDIHPLIGQESLVYDNLGLLVSAKEHPLLWVLATSIGVLSFYRLWLTGVGLREGGYKVSSTAGWGVAITFWILGLIFFLIWAAIFPGFLGD